MEEENIGEVIEIVSVLSSLLDHLFPIVWLVGFS
jgi:hypothetical protein